MLQDRPKYADRLVLFRCSKDYSVFVWDVIFIIQVIRLQVVTLSASIRIANMHAVALGFPHREPGARSLCHVKTRGGIREQSAAAAL